MVDTISSANGVRQAGAGAARHGSPSGSSSQAATSKAVEPVAASDAPAQREQNHREERDAPREPGQRENAPAGLRLQISEDADGNEIVYRFVDAQTGNVVGEWDADQIGKLRDFVRAKNIHIFDKKV